MSGEKAPSGAQKSLPGTEPAVLVAALGCMVNLNAGQQGAAVDLCGQPAVYKAWVHDCYICWMMDFPECIGHPVCVKHGAEMRAHQMPDRRVMTSLTRISSLGAGSMKGTKRER